MHREQLTVELGADEAIIRHHELGADHQGFDSADEEKQNREAAIEHADLFVVDGRQPADEASFCGRAREKSEGGSPLGCLFAGETGLGDYFCHKYEGEGGAKS